ncbi:MAG TPA: TonB-dependent receptor [Candidatus Sulfotelmatobacter sp.]|nr:TonB-dependent receptor [Candidatus Sulfotelmatobacter sp.]
MFRFTSAARHSLVLFASVLLFGAMAHAQFRASLRGTVTDTQGASVPGATVTLVNTQTNQTMVATSDANGIYQFNALGPASYHLTAEHEGFKKKVLDNVQIIPEQLNALDLQLEIGEVQQTVTVSGTIQTLDTETATIGGTITDVQIQHMPSFGRDVLKVAALAPGAFADNSQASGNDNYNLPGTQTSGGQSGGADGIFKTENGAQIIANGNQTENNGISIDGISTTSSVWGGSTIITPSEDSVDNVKVVSNGYDAENGRFSGAQIQITSKGGSNQFHGSLFFTTHQPNLNAFQPYNGFSNKVLRDENHFEQFGGSVGGPIWKNKIFAFFAYETVREPNSNITGNGWYDTAAFAALAPAGSIASTYLNFPGNGVITTGINPGGNCAAAGLTEGVNCVTIPGQGINVGTPLTTPLGTQDLGWVSVSSPGVGSGLGTVADIANYNTSDPTTFNAAQYNGRLDADVTSRDRISFAIYWVPQSKTNFNGNRAYDLFHHEQVNNAVSAIWDRTISSSFLNEARVNAAGWRWNEISSNPQSPVGLPTDFIDQTGSITLNQWGPNVGSVLDQWTYTYKDVATKIVGRHTIKFGGDLTRLHYLNNCVACGVPSYHFFNIWDFLNDAPHEEGAGYNGFNPNTGLPTTERQDDRENLLGFFVQDDFKVTTHLTVNLGLRWSYFSPLSSKENNMFVATPGAGADFLTGLTVRRGNSWNAQKNNFGPQVGFAWNPAVLNGKFVVRGGYGLNYNQEEIAVSSGIGTNPGLIVTPTFSMSTPTSPNPGIVYGVSSDPHSFTGYPPNPNAIVSFGPNGLPTTGSTNISLFPTTLPTMRVHHYSLDTEYDFGHNLIATLGYMGSVSHNIFFHESPNAVPAALGYTLNPQIGGGDYWNVNGYSNYNAMLAELKHQFSHQFMADAQFTWAKSMDTSSGPYFEQDYPYNIPINYGRSDFNVGKSFKLYGMWQPVFFHGNRAWVDKVVGGWTLSGIFNIHSGFPWSPVLSVNGGSLYCGTCGYTALLPAANLGGAGTSASNGAFEGSTSSNFPAGGLAYFALPAYTAYSGTDFGTAVPQSPGVERNSLNLPGYRDVDASIAKGFGLPNNRVLGEGARIELRMDAYNVFNNLNLNPNEISNNIANPNFGTISGALAGRVVTLGARFSF